MNLQAVLYFVCVFGMGLVRDSLAVPVSVLSNDLSSSAEEDEDIPIIDDDITTHGLERLSSAATCLVAGVEYTHGQQIYRADQCEFCLCLDGEMFCWWQDCPPTMEGPCRDRGPFSPCASIPVAPPNKSSSSSSASPMTSSTTKTGHKATTSTVESTNNDASSEHSYSTADNLTDSSQYFTEETEVNGSSETPPGTTSEEPKTCTIMGKEYQVGDKLPHDTGNCLECVCGQGAKVTCFPHQCAPAGDEINDYRPPGPREPVPDAF